MRVDGCVSWGNAAPRSVAWQGTYVVGADGRCSEQLRRVLTIGGPATCVTCPMPASWMKACTVPKPSEFGLGEPYASARPRR